MRPSHIGNAATTLRGLYRLATGELPAALPVPLVAYPTAYMFRDVDGAGLAEMWPPMAIPGATGSSFAIDFMNLDAANPQVVVISTVFKLLLVGATSGAVLYDSSADPAIPTGREVDAVLVDDFDVDGHDDVLLTLVNPNNGVKRVFLIGASGSLSSVEGLSGGARLRIFDAAGRLVREVADEHVAVGSHTRAWDGRDEQGRDVASSIYFYELDVEGKRMSSKLVQVR
jgi:hypothetical protein